MADLHPFVVHFPIALLLTAAGFDLFSVMKKHAPSSRTAYVLQIVGSLSALPAAFSGNLAQSSVMGQERLSAAVEDSISLHVSFGNIVVWLVVILVVFRTFSILEKKEWALSGWLFPVLNLLIAVLVLVTGFLGGNLSHDILQYFINN